MYLFYRACKLISIKKYKKYINYSYNKKLDDPGLITGYFRNENFRGGLLFNFFFLIERYLQKLLIMQGSKMDMILYAIKEFLILFLKKNSQ